MKGFTKLKTFLTVELTVSILVMLTLLVFFFLLTSRVTFPVSIDLGPFQIHYYAIFILLSISVATYLVSLLWKRYFPDLKSDISEILLFLLIPGLIGARLYHVLTEWSYYQIHPEQIIAFWQGGLGLIGALIGGTFGLYLLAKHYKISFLTAIETIVLVLPIAQAIGRLANVFNYEIYGQPTDLPWALFVPIQYRISGYITTTLYQPLFWYEAAANLALFWLLFAVYRKFGLGKWLVVIYVLGYGAIRFCLDFWRLEGNTGIAGLSYTQWLIAIVYTAVVGWIGYRFLVRHKKL